MKIGLYQNAPKHTEIMGTFIEFCKVIGAECIIYSVADIDRYSFVNYYVALMGYRKITFKQPDEIIKDYVKLDKIIVNTNSDLLPKDFEQKKEIWHKIVYVSHQNYHSKKFMINNITVSPTITGEHYEKYMSKCILPIYKSNNYVLKKKQNIYAVVGALREHGHDREIRHLLKICGKYKNSGNVMIYLFMRKDDFKRFKARCPSLVDNPIVRIFKGLGSEEMLDILKNVKFIMPLARDGGWFHTQRLTGTIPLALNNNIPLIIDKKLNDIYGLKGNVCYNFDEGDVDFLNKFEVSLSIDDELYGRMTEKVIKCKNRIVDENVSKLKDFLKGVEENNEELTVEVEADNTVKTDNAVMNEITIDKPMDKIINAVKKDKKAISEDMFGINNSIDRIINSSRGNLENTESQLIKNMKKESKNKPVVPKIVSTVGMSKEHIERVENEKQQREIEMKLEEEREKQREIEMRLKEEREKQQREVEMRLEEEREKQQRDIMNIVNNMKNNTMNGMNNTLGNMDLGKIIENQRIIMNDLQLIKSKLFNF